VLTEGGNLRELYGMAVDVTGQLVVADRGLRGLVRVNPQTGAQQVIAGFNSFVDPRGVAVYTIPEPASAGLAACGMLVLSAHRRRRTS
jgi:hypothetical protein